MVEEGEGDYSSIILFGMLGSVVYNQYANSTKVSGKPAHKYFEEKEDLGSNIN